ncbi:ring-1,2-phenylacetyl-CoA epoxidase subunit PaaE [Streptoalloteichus tenebrarius]|uniref:Ring-1,2-phenylacetyl-CoA epoxidase subunit PaaE n=1 Tax=Streptoalloteichus tenebrarius (strain ATCC 17920 / DSM 40477 / JCM 4838 / CBS 697.72 / NBRC 16177 / NCIMB 11028 / NRRL B-12390 / A12253. 1 / ISP 5477) TaxID=1933 RepID=A0ABT1HY18_STRSD|nr:1,2-phenylacetyl-CoA epoxidase subunit PaaE [Streptoalloteichus tenebrarius]MCP2260414.1 ring-1,2-phenylacetyl-CoA epoxidase subunit PaaE [Streptoalloteichus tenebrarius]BFF02477.1 phenylacetate-CoA oxygenase/reductase subunit PaaK [Streptoalloteichus tenebrarius]
MAAPTLTRRPARRSTFHELTVAGVDRLCADAVAVTFDVPAELAGDFDFRAGQYLTLRRRVDGREERRSYSICAPVGAAPRIGVRRVEGGLFSEWLVDSVRPGDVVEVLPPLGGFCPDLDAPAHHCLVAAGSGITPVLSIVSSVLAANEGNRVTLLYGNRRTDTVMFAEELADLKDRYRSRLQLVHVLSREPRDVELFSGRLDADRLRRLFATVVPAADVDEWWLCGPYGMVRDAEAVLAERGVPRERVHHELFYVDEPPPEPVRHDEQSTVDGPASEVVVLLEGRETALTLPRSTPILDAAQRVRADLPFACKGGVCGTCRARLVEGEVRMRRNYALEDHEVAAGFVLTCQSLPVTERVVVDYDA